MSIHNYTFGPPRGGWPEFDESGRIIVKSERTAVVVLGPEASGTRMITEFCIRAGFFGDSGHGQRLDHLKFDAAPDRIVFRRSLPHAGAWPDLLDIHSRLEKANYTNIHYIFVFRDPRYNVLAQLRVGHVREAKQGYENILRALNDSWEAFQILDVEPLVVVYEQWVESEELRDVIAAVLGVETPEMDFYNANDKYNANSVPPSQKLDAIYTLARKLRIV